MGFKFKYLRNGVLFFLKMSSRETTPMGKISGSILPIKGIRWRRLSRHLGLHHTQRYIGINQHSYEEILENAILPSKDLMYSPESAWIFQQDGASAQNAKSMKTINSFPEFLGQPDLSISIQFRIFDNESSQT